MEPTIDGKPLSSLRVVDLKQELEKRGISKSGTKKDLIDKLKTRLELEALQSSDPIIHHQTQGSVQVANISLTENLPENNEYIKAYLADQAFHQQILNPPVMIESVQNYYPEVRQEPTGAPLVPQGTPFIVSHVPVTVHEAPSAAPIINSEVQMAAPTETYAPAASAVLISTQPMDQVIVPQDSVAPVPVVTESNIITEEPMGQVPVDPEANEPKEPVVETSIPVAEEATPVPLPELPTYVESEEKTDPVDLSQRSTTDAPEVQQEVPEDQRDSVPVEEAPSKAPVAEPEVIEKLDVVKPEEVQVSGKEEPVVTDEKNQLEEDKGDGRGKEVPVESSGSPEPGVKETVAATVDKKTEENDIKETRRESDDKKDEGSQKKKRRWGKSGSMSGATGVNTDQLKGLLGPNNLKVSETKGRDVNDGSAQGKGGQADSLIETSIQISTPIISSAGSGSQSTPGVDSEKREVRVVRKSAADEDKVIPDVTAVNGNKDEEAPQVKEATPPRNPPANFLFIRNLTRPFTLNQLQELLKTHGAVVADQFWIDRIKSKCIVSYETVDDAQKARDALHGLRWPEANPKTLNVDFSSEDELASHRNTEKAPPVTPATPIPAPTPEPSSKDKYDVVIRKTSNDVSAKRSVREWDKDKLKEPSPPRKRGRSPRDGDKEKVDENQVVNDAPENKKDAEQESPAKLLDDLFRKTSVTPAVYWLPLSEEEAEKRVAVRKEAEKRRLDDVAKREAAWAEENRRRDEDMRSRRNMYERRSPPPVRRYNSPRGRGAMGGYKVPPYPGRPRSPARGPRHSRSSSSGSRSRSRSPIRRRGGDDRRSPPGHRRSPPAYRGSSPVRRR